MGSQTRRNARGTGRVPVRRGPAVAELRQAKKTLAALNLAGTRLLSQTDERAIANVICRELVRLGFQSAVLTLDGDIAGAKALRWSASSFGADVQRLTERILGQAVSDIRVPVSAAPLARRVLQRGRTVYSPRAEAAAREVFGCRDPRKIERLSRLMRLRHAVFAPLRRGGETVGILAVAAPLLRRSDPEAIDAFAAQASMALENAHLVAQLKAGQAQLESEVERRTQELTLAVERLEEADRRKDNFLANVSHELRTPLVTVLGYTDLLLSEKLGSLSPQQRGCLDVVSSSGRRLRNFIEELLELSRWELTRERLTLSTVDVGALLRIAALTVAPRFAQRGVRLRWRTAPGAPSLWGDRDRLLQVLTNLLNNAERHSQPGGRVRLFAAASGAGKVGIAVSDDGEGISPEHLDRIFDRLYQVGDSGAQRQRGAGLGLGLAIAKGIAESHGGTIDVRSRVGHGTRFVVTLPTEDAARAEPSMRREPRPVTRNR